MDDRFQWRRNIYGHSGLVRTKFWQNHLRNAIRMIDSLKTYQFVRTKFRSPDQVRKRSYATALIWIWIKCWIEKYLGNYNFKNYFFPFLKNWYQKRNLLMIYWIKKMKMTTKLLSKMNVRPNLIPLNLIMMTCQIQIMKIFLKTEVCKFWKYWTVSIKNPFPTMTF